jgi:hypothetical protein
MPIWTLPGATRPSKNAWLIVLGNSMQKTSEEAPARLWPSNRKKIPGEYSSEQSGPNDVDQALSGKNECVCGP